MALRALKPDTTSVDLDDLLTGSKTTEITYPSGKVVTVQYNPQLLTGDLLLELNSLQGKPDVETLPVVAKFLSTVLTEWDLARKGVRLAITTEVMMGLPVGVLLPIVVALQTEQTPDPQPAPTS